MSGELKQGDVLQAGQEVAINTREGNVYMRARVKSIGRSRIVLEPLPGEAKEAGIKNKKGGRIKK